MGDWDMGDWIATGLIWLFIAGTTIFVLIKWRQVGRDPDRGVIIPRFSPPQNLSPAALHFVYRRGAAEGDVLHGGTLGQFADFLDRGLVGFVPGSEPPQLVRLTKQAKTQSKPLPDDAKLFLDIVLPPGPPLTLSAASARSGAHRLRLFHTNDLGRRYFRTNLVLSLGAFAIMAVGILLGAALMRGENALALSFTAGWVATLLGVASNIVRRSSVTAQRWMALAMGLGACFVAVLFVFFHIPAPDTVVQDLPDMIADLGAFLVTPLTFLFGWLLMAPTKEGQQLLDEIEGFRMFIAVADGGRHAIDNAPDPTTDSLNALLPYAIALHVEAGWSNALARDLPLPITSSNN